MTGFSGAKIQLVRNSDGLVMVRKEMANAHEQAILMINHPLKEVSPHIFSIEPYYYTMQRLEPLTIPMHGRDAHKTLIGVRKLLSRHVWKHRVHHQSDGWQYELATRFHSSIGVDILDHIENLWRDQNVWQYIHGDPTLSNTMLSSYKDVARSTDEKLVLNERLMLIDPLNSSYIPCHWTVDMGKLLQSAIGWERALCGWYYDRKVCVDTLLDGLDLPTQRRCWFWCMVHCMRIVPYAHRADNGPIKEWAKSRAEILWSILKDSPDQDIRGEVCDTLLT